MQGKAELHLVVPGICGPLADTRFLQESDVLKKWIGILSRSQYSTIQKSSIATPSADTVFGDRVYQNQENQYTVVPDDANRVIASIVKLPVEADFPGAALIMMANDLFDQSLFYMFADPVHLMADMDHAVLTSCLDLEITEQESTALIEVLNKHFEQDDFELVYLNKNQWLVASKNRIQMKTTSLEDAVGRNINFILPQGKDAGYWKKMLTEAQMLLHTHEINQLRENNNRQSINSLWFHGTGLLKGGVDGSVFNLCSNRDELRGLSEYIKCHYQKLPESASDYITQILSAKNSVKNILHLTNLEHLVNYTDVNPWLLELTELLENWIYPLLNFAHKNNIKVTLYPCNDRQYHFSKYDFLKFWVRQGNIEQHVSSY